ncbi:LacI family DNA-binding transcriptional regulator [Botrimarina hoheduenensis]|uniref:Ribose operon repressor n=1 Tax=Botrimarina hoheduenensis TaxID=2528000 RepID=A0A5C5WA49_9BACT|nr:LacI family DNA-binding transcriptional regulator [Botrimarina hoheduenensis]TWT47530.1 Ribose operon repressor [Botrimarina hoheduenensis]
MEPPRVPRLKDVAAAANVSVSAASKILRGDQSRFGEDTCRRVAEAAKRLGWRRNLLVSGIQTGRTQTVGVMIPPYDSFWVNVLSGIHRRLAEADYLPITVWQGDLDHMPHFEADEQEGVRQINRLLDRRVDGLIMWPSFGLAYEDHLADLHEKNVPVVVIDHSSDNPFCDAVTTNETQATKAVAKHLLDLGHRRIACISTRESKSQTWALERRDAFENAVHQQPDAQCMSWRLNPIGSNGVEVARELLGSELRPSAVFAVTDHEAACVYEAAASLGLSIPADLSVVGFADLDFAVSMAPPLSTVRQRPLEIGAHAASMVLDRLNGPLAGEPLGCAKIDADLILRESTGPARR